MEVLIAVSVQRAVVLVVTTCRLIYLSSLFSTMKLELVGSTLYMVETELVASFKLLLLLWCVSVVCVVCGCVCVCIL
jgi:hypothetical protein